MLGVASLASSVALLLSGAAGQAAQASSSPVLTLSITGRGWGHGIGMSQWGAYGFAQRGASYQEILAHYYRGTELAKAPGSQMRVLVVEDAKTLLIGSFAPFVVEDGAGERHQLEAASYRLDAKLELAGAALPPPLTFRPQGQPLLINGSPYRGTLRLTVAKGKLRGVNTLPLESYLLGVVPREVPSGWPVEALKAQAVAARSYALATRKTGGEFDVYADVRSQVYGGIGAEVDATTAAVRATAREVLRHDGKIATTYFFSTSGGRTVDISEAWPGSPQVPYLVSVPDPYDSESPVHRWGPVAAPAAKLRRALKLPRNPVAARVVAGPSGRVSELVLTLADGREVSVPGSTVRTALELRSTWFRFGMLSLTPPKRSPVVFGSKARLGVAVRGVSRVVLERRVAGGAWETVGPAKGTSTVAFRGERTVFYRLAGPNLKSAPLRVPVAPKVNMGEAFRGAVRPVTAGATVEVQRQEGSRWVPFATAELDDAGRFDAGVDAPPGTYRARFAPGNGLVPGFSRPLTVP